MPRPYSLSAIQAGITRLADKGGASPVALYDLVDGFVTAARKVRPRPGSKSVASIPGTLGLSLLKGVLQVFADTPVAVPAGYKLNILTHLTNPAARLESIEFAEPFMGALYVIARWDVDPAGYYRDYWLVDNEDWKPSTGYQLGDVVSPPGASGLYFRAVRRNPADKVWVGDTPRTLNEYVEPTTFNGFKYKAVAVTGTAPKSGSTEPTWPTAEGGRVYEDSDLAPVENSAPPTQTVPGTGGIVTPPSVGDRYDRIPSSER